MIVVLEQNINERDLIVKKLKELYLKVNIQVATDCDDALKKIRSGESCSLIIVGIGNENLEEISFLIKEATLVLKNTHIIFMALNNIEREIALYKVGGNIFIQKPFVPELFSAICKKYVNLEKKIIKINEFVINKENCTIHKNDTYLKFTQKEYDIFLLMSERIGQVISREEMINTIWNDETEINPRSIDFHMNKIRGLMGKERRYLKTVNGMGYRMTSGN